jgi:hypothetical protein
LDLKEIDDLAKEDDNNKNEALNCK